MNAVLKPLHSDQYAIADLSLADWGRKELRIAETEMPALMAIREEYAKTQPLAGRTMACPCASRRAPGRNSRIRDRNVPPRRRGVRPAASKRGPRMD